jgi:hypothetical protein
MFIEMVPYDSQLIFLESTRTVPSMYTTEPSVVYNGTVLFVSYQKIWVLPRPGSTAPSWENFEPVTCCKDSET